MKSLHIFQIYVIKEKINSKGHFGNMKSQRSPWNSIYVKFSHENRAGTSLLMLLVDRLLKENYSPHLI